MHDTITFLLVTLPNIHRFLKYFFHSHTQQLTTPSHLKSAATLFCNLLLGARFADINVSQGSVATYARCGGIFNIRLTANLPENIPVKKLLKSVKIWQDYGQFGHASVAPLFWSALYSYCRAAVRAE